MVRRSENTIGPGLIHILSPNLPHYEVIILPGIIISGQGRRSNSGSGRFLTRSEGELFWGHCLGTLKWEESPSAHLDSGQSMENTSRGHCTTEGN